MLGGAHFKGLDPVNRFDEGPGQTLAPPPVLKSSVAGQRPQILVLKVGTSTLMKANGHSFSLANLGKFVDAVCDLKERGYHVVMISSGAVGSGCVHMHLHNRPKEMVEKQAISAVGQCRLVRLWEDIFAIREAKVAQLLVTRTDLIYRPRFVNFRNTLLQLLNMDVIPIINENDALATEGLKFGDNDTLGAYVSVSIGANWYFMLTDVDCLFTANPRHHPDAKPVAYVGKIDRISTILDADENEGTEWGSGGMRTKIIAAKLCCATGIHTALCHGAFPERILDIVGFAEAKAPCRKALSTSTTCTPVTVTHHGSDDNVSGCSPEYPAQPLSSNFVAGLKRAATSVARPENNQLPGLSGPVDSESDLSDSPLDKDRKLAFITFPNTEAMPYVGTIFAGQPCTQSLRDQRRWILSLPVRGRIYLDDATCRAVIEKRKSLYALGVVDIKDDFYPGEAVALLQATGSANSDEEREENELARCLVNFSSHELHKIKGKKSCDFQRVLGYYCAHEVAHKSDIIFVNPGPVYEKYHVKITREMVESSDEEEQAVELEQPTFSPVPVPVEGETQFA